MNVYNGSYKCNAISYLLLYYCMNQLELFGNQSEHNNQDNNLSKNLKQKRPPNISISENLLQQPQMEIMQNHWQKYIYQKLQLSLCLQQQVSLVQKRLYLYGGYQILNGSLKDFYAISLDQSLPTFVWEDIHAQGKINPGCRSKHCLLGGKSKIYLIGGLKANNQASDQIFEYNPLNNEWTLLKPEGVKLPPLQSFSSLILTHQSQQVIIIAFGFNEQKASPSNVIYQYKISKNKLSILFEGTQVIKPQVPSPRTGCAMAFDGTNLIIFGGKDQNQRLNDIWSFNLEDFKFARLKDQGEVPTVRNGHTMNHHNGKLYLFGGIHDITWQLDDLHIYNIKSNQWTTLEQDSPRKVQKKKNNANNIDKQDYKGKKKYNQTQQSPNKNNILLSPSKGFSITYHEDANRNESPGKMLDQQRKKIFYQKKAEMLKNFQISKEEKEKFLILQTSSQAMKNSLDVIGKSDQTFNNDNKLTDFGKQSVSKFLQPLENNSNIVIGKRPCARDGHCSVLIGEDLIIFGGDRHQMSFNDIYKLNLQLAEKDINH